MITEDKDDDDEGSTSIFFLSPYISMIVLAISLGSFFASSALVRKTGTRSLCTSWQSGKLMTSLEAATNSVTAATRALFDDAQLLQLDSYGVWF